MSGLLLLLVSLTAQAQQNLFNVPSSDITPENRLFFQQQVNFYHNEVVFNSTFSYGLGHNAEIGVNLLGWQARGDFWRQGFAHNDDPSDGEPLYPFIMLNAQKAFPLTKTFKLSLGTQVGNNVLTDWQHVHLEAYGYVNAVREFLRTHTKLILGLYAGDNDFIGNESSNGLFPHDHSLSRLGIQTGIEQAIVPHKLLFIADFISGQHSFGQSVFGLAYNLTPKWVLSAGYQVANPFSQTSNGVVLEVTYVPKEKESARH